MQIEKFDGYSFPLTRGRTSVAVEFDVATVPALNLSRV